MSRTLPPPPPPLTPADLAFDATYIFIHGGTLRAGTEAVPFLNQLTITLHGDRYNTLEIPMVGAKCLVAMNTEAMPAGAPDPTATGPAPTNAGALAAATANAFRPFSLGSIEIHGRPRRRVWTILGADVLAGTSAVYTAEPVDFAPGELVVVTSSDYDFTHAEEAGVVALINSTYFTVNITFKYDHRGTVVPGADVSWDSDIDMRAEVGLVTRNIVIQGDETSDSQLFGVHTGVFEGGIFHLENAELRHCGQGFLLGRYCTHFVSGAGLRAQGPSALTLLPLSPPLCSTRPAARTRLTCASTRSTTPTSARRPSTTQTALSSSTTSTTTSAATRSSSRTAMSSGTSSRRTLSATR